MTQVTYYVAVSIDGYIATSNGGIDWLSCVEMQNEDYGYAEFYDSVNGLLMGHNTYEQIQKLGSWPYGKKPCWVWSNNTIESTPSSVIETTSSPKEITQYAQKQGLEHLWLVGGGILAAEFANQHLINKYIISIIPVMLGQGIPLIYGKQTHNLKLVENQHYESGLVQLTYTPKIKG